MLFTVGSLGSGAGTVGGGIAGTLVTPGVGTVGSGIEDLVSYFADKKRKKFKAEAERACTTYEDDPCRGLKEQMERLMKELDKRTADALIDKEGQYDQFVAGNITSSTKWLGHKDQYYDVITRLKRLRNAADYFSCEYDRARVMCYENRPFPSSPLPRGR